MESEKILEISRAQQQSPCSQFRNNSLPAKENTPNMCLTVIAGQKEQREPEESITGPSLDATDAPMKLCELIGNSNTGQQCLAENGTASNCNMPSFQSEPVSYNSHLINGDRSSSGRSCYIWADADLQSKENIEGKVFGQGQQERSTTETTAVTAVIHSGCCTAFEPKCDSLDDFFLNDDVAGQNLRGSTVHPSAQDKSLDEGPVNYSAAADDSDMNCGSIPHETSGKTTTLESEENKRCSRTQNIRSPARRSERAGEAQDQAESCASETDHPSSSHTSLEDMVSSSSEADGFRESYTWFLENNGDKEHDSTCTFMSHEDERVDAEGSGLRSFGRKSGCRAIRCTIRYRRTTGLPTQAGHTGGVGGVEGDGYDAQGDVEPCGPRRNLVAVLRSAPEGNSSPMLPLEVRPRTPQEHDHTW